MKILYFFRISNFFSLLIILRACGPWVSRAEVFWCQRDWLQRSSGCPASWLDCRGLASTCSVQTSTCPPGADPAEDSWPPPETESHSYKHSGTWQYPEQSSSLDEYSKRKLIFTWQTDSSTLTLFINSFSNTPGAEFICSFSLIDSLFLTVALKLFTPSWYSPDTVK